MILLVSFLLLNPQTANHLAAHQIDKQWPEVRLNDFVRAESPDDDLTVPTKLYEDGLREGNLAMLKRAFAPNGSFCYQVSDGTGPTIQCKTFEEVLPTWTNKPDPATRGKILTSEIVGSMARITYELSFGGQVFKDFLLLYKVDKQWVIVAKTTQVNK